MGKKSCQRCKTSPATIRRPKDGSQVCTSCFFYLFEEEVHTTIVREQLFEEGEKVAIGASGGKDSTVLAYVLKLLNQRHSYGLELILLSIDEGISGYRDDSLEAVKRNQVEYQLPLKILSYNDLYGWTMDRVVEKTGRRSNCTFCGVFRRQALDRGADVLDANKLATGHNADDIAETVLMNILRGDYPRLLRCADAVTGKNSKMPRVKPFKYTYEKEIVLYAYHKKLDYFATECIYSPEAYRGHARQFIKDIEAIRSTSIIDTIRSAEEFSHSVSSATTKMPKLGKCAQCGYIASQPLCKSCTLLNGLNATTEKPESLSGKV